MYVKWLAFLVLVSLAAPADADLNTNVVAAEDITLELERQRRFQQLPSVRVGEKTILYPESQVKFFTPRKSMLKFFSARIQFDLRGEDERDGVELNLSLYEFRGFSVLPDVIPNHTMEMKPKLGRSASLSFTVNF